MMAISERALREAIVESFSKEELDRIRADVQETLAARNVRVRLGVDDLGGTGYEAQVLKLIQALRRVGELATLVDAVIAERPALFGAPPAASGPGPTSTPAPPQWQVDIRMKKLPTSIYHLLDKETNPLFTAEIRNNAQPRNVRLTAQIAAYSVESVDNRWLDAGESHTFPQLPVFTPGVIRTLSEIAPATLNVRLDDLTDNRVLAHTGFDLRLHPPTTVFLEMQDESTKVWKDMTPYIGTFVTPNNAEVQRFVHDAASEVDTRRFVGYQHGPAAVLPQVRGLFEAFKKSGIVYNSFVETYASEPGVAMQRVQLPRYTLDRKLANCVDGQVLFASALEFIGLSAGLVYILAAGTGHALAAWETERGNGDWQYLDTTKIAEKTFDETWKGANALAKAFEEASKGAGDPRMFRRHALTALRRDGITPME